MKNHPTLHLTHRPIYPSVIPQTARRPRTVAIQQDRRRLHDLCIPQLDDAPSPTFLIHIVCIDQLMCKGFGLVGEIRTKGRVLYEVSNYHPYTLLIKWKIMLIECYEIYYCYSIVNIIVETKLIALCSVTLKIR